MEPPPTSVRVTLVDVHVPPEYTYTQHGIDESTRCDDLLPMVQKKIGVVELNWEHENSREPVLKLLARTGASAVVIRMRTISYVELRIVWPEDSTQDRVYHDWYVFSGQTCAEFFRTIQSCHSPRPVFWEYSSSPELMSAWMAQRGRSIEMTFD